MFVFLSVAYSIYQNGAQWHPFSLQMPWFHFYLELNKLLLCVSAMFSVTIHLDKYPSWFYFLVIMNHETRNLFLCECRNRGQWVFSVPWTLCRRIWEREIRLKEHIYYEESQVRWWGNMVTEYSDIDVTVTPLWREPSWKICKSKIDRSWFLV